jgi:hypothetical protein
MRKEDIGDYSNGSDDDPQDERIIPATEFKIQELCRQKDEASFSTAEYASWQ